MTRATARSPATLNVRGGDTPWRDGLVALLLPVVSLGRLGRLRGRRCGRAGGRGGGRSRAELGGDGLGRGEDALRRGIGQLSVRAERGDGCGELREVVVRLGEVACFCALAHGGGLQLERLLGLLGDTRADAAARAAGAGEQREAEPGRRDPHPATPTIAHQPLTADSRSDSASSSGGGSDAGGGAVVVAVGPTAGAFDSLDRLSMIATPRRTSTATTASQPHGGVVRCGRSGTGSTGGAPAGGTSTGSASTGSEGITCVASAVTAPGSAAVEVRSSSCRSAAAIAAADG